MGVGGADSGDGTGEGLRGLNGAWEGTQGVDKAGRQATAQHTPMSGGRHATTHPVAAGAHEAAAQRLAADLPQQLLAGRRVQPHQLHLLAHGVHRVAPRH